MARHLTLPFSFDPETGTRRTFHYDGADDTFTIETEQPVQDLIDTNKVLANADNYAGQKWQGDMHKVASIPLNIYFDLKQQGIIDDPKRFKAWLNDPDNRYFRTKGGRV